MVNCKFCGRECTSKHSVNSHQALCKSNPEGKSPKSWATGNRKGIPSWNSGLVGDPRLKHSVETKKLISDKVRERTPEWHKENGKRISETVNKKVADGTWHTSLARNMHYTYDNVDLHGSWELEYAKYLDKNGILWKRNKDSFEYVFEGKARRYTPDFYLTQTDEYIEIKGYKTEKDEAKWSQFPSHRKLKILMKEQLRSLGINI